MNFKLLSLAGASLLLTALSLAAKAQTPRFTTPPAPEVFKAQTEPNFVSVPDILEFRSLPEYNEPDWVTSKYVETGLLPPVKDRLPREPLAYKAGNMPDGIGVYGDTLRHVTGGRPEGWNYVGGQSQGWGGVDNAMLECMTRTAPLFQIKAEDLEPLPNLAKSWEWSEDGRELTMHLIEGAKWSDGDLFDSQDVMFYWEDNVLDKSITPTNGATQGTFGAETKLEAIDAYTIKWTFKTPFPTQILYEMAYGTFCPGPSHILKPEHPKYSDNTYAEYKNAFPPKYLNMPVMGAWVPVAYRSEDIIVMRRNPYYWKVDEAGNQLPYIDEIQYRLSTWDDRDIQAVAGGSDFSNLERPENFLEALRRSGDDTAPASLTFGPRTIGYALEMNYSANGWGAPNKREQAVRELNRDLNFRIAISSAIDRLRIGESLIRGPFTAVYPGGLLAGTNYYDAEATAYYPPDIELSARLLDQLGMVDTDGNGIRNFPKSTGTGADVEITLMAPNDNQSERGLVEHIVLMMEPLGIRVVSKMLPNNTLNDLKTSGRYDWMIIRQSSAMVSVVQNTPTLAPTGPRTSSMHGAGTDGTLDLLPFEQLLVDIVNAFISTSDLEERTELMKQYQEIFTQNVYAIGLTQFPGALIMNRRFANIPKGMPIFMFGWAEDAIMRERLFVPLDKQRDYELFPEMLPGKPGEDGPR